MININKKIPTMVANTDLKNPFIVVLFLFFAKLVINGKTDKQKSAKNINKGVSRLFFPTSFLIFAASFVEFKDDDKMKKEVLMAVFMTAFLSSSFGKGRAEVFPDGSPIPEWFSDTTKVDVERLGKQYVVTDYGVGRDSTMVQTEALQRVIDLAASQGGGVVVIPEGTFLSGSLFFRQGTHLHLRPGGKLKGSEQIADFPIMETRIEGETCKYFAALVNADGLDGFTITGKGTIDGNGFRYWQAFWIRRKWNPDCTNKDEQRPRLTYLSNCRNVTVQDVRLVNSPFWTNHVYKSDHVRYIDLFIYSSTEGLKAPSTDAIDIDACHDVLVRGCYMNVNDDAVVLKGGKGTYADLDKNNGPCYNIIVENCRYGTVHGCLTLGSESLHDRNVILRNCYAENTNNVLWLKMRPDTPQHYEFIRVENITGHCRSFLLVRPWTQFFKPQERHDMPRSQCNDISFKNIRMTCDNFFNVNLSDKFDLCRFSFEDIDVQDKANAFDKTLIEHTTVKNMRVNGVKVK